MEKLRDCRGNRACIHAMDMMTATALERDIQFLRSILGFTMLCHTNLLYYSDRVTDPYTTEVVNTYRDLYSLRRTDTSMDLMRSLFDSATNEFLGLARSGEFWIPGERVFVCAVWITI